MKILGTKIIFGSKKVFGYKNNCWVRKSIWVQKRLRIKKVFWPKKLFGSKKVFKSKKILHEWAISRYCHLILPLGYVGLSHDLDVLRIYLSFIFHVKDGSLMLDIQELRIFGIYLRFRELHNTNNQDLDVGYSGYKDI